jgi:hypothetical protein
MSSSSSSNDNRSSKKQKTAGKSGESDAVITPPGSPINEKGSMFVLPMSPDKGKTMEVTTSTKDSLLVLPLTEAVVKPTRKPDIFSHGCLSLVATDADPGKARIMPTTAWFNGSRKSQPITKAVNALKSMAVNKPFIVQKAHLNSGSAHGLRGEELVFQEDTIVRAKPIARGSTVKAIITDNNTVFDSIDMLENLAHYHKVLLHVRVSSVAVMEGKTRVAAQVVVYDGCGQIEVVVFNKSSPLVKAKVGTAAVIYGSIHHSTEDGKKLTILYETASFQLDVKKYGLYSLAVPSVVAAGSRGSNISEARTISDILASPVEKTEWRNNVPFIIKAVVGYYAHLYCAPCVNEHGYSYKLINVDNAWSCKSCNRDLGKDDMELRCSPTIEFELVGTEDFFPKIYTGIIAKGQELEVFGRTLDEFKKGAAPCEYKDIPMEATFAMSSGKMGVRIMKIKRI